ncbi:hypothetical protein DRI60_23865, partial [Salmonella enterica]|nr:hypothetical protein [Salmonella enterica subsp. enterica serovar Senftenberg]EAT5874890.1 hypothetical protein [Salmonella enterica]EBN5787813.1 hypothetical protein [Salmonella enterica]
YREYRHIRKHAYSLTAATDYEDAYLKSYLFNKAVWLVILVVLAIDQIAQSGLNSLKVIYFSA